MVRSTGFDCSGFVMFVYASIGKSVPHYTVDIWNAFPRVPLDQLAPGDLILTDGLGHMGIYMGIYMGNGQYIHVAADRRRGKDLAAGRTCR